MSAPSQGERVGFRFFDSLLWLRSRLDLPSEILDPIPIDRSKYFLGKVFFFVCSPVLDGGHGDDEHGLGLFYFSNNLHLFHPDGSLRSLVFRRFGFFFLFLGRCPARTGFPGIGRNRSWADPRPGPEEEQGQTGQGPPGRSRIGVHLLSLANLRSILQADLSAGFHLAPDISG